jgi:cell division protein FtsQ
LRSGTRTRTRPAPAPVPAPAGIDPRIRARRIEVQRHAGRRRLRRVVDAALVLVVTIGFVVALRSPLLDVDEVRVAGTIRLSAEQVLERAGVEPGDQLVEVDPGAVGRRVAALPWAGEVSVHRQLGGRVDIRVAEREPVALVGTGPEAVVVDGQGRGLAFAGDVPEVAAELLQVRGLAGGSTVAPGRFLPRSSQAALDLAGQLAAAVPGAIAEVELGEDLRATLVQGGRVRFGDTSRLPAKLRSLATVLEQVDLTCLAEMDLRAPGSPVLTRLEGCS